MTGFLATTASADFSSPLGSGISQGKVPRLSARAVEYGLPCLSRNEVSRMAPNTPLDADRLLILIASPTPENSPVMT